MTSEMPPADAMCPKCGYFTARMVGGVLTCDRPGEECGYEHIVTTTLPIIKPPTNQG